MFLFGWFCKSLHSTTVEIKRNRIWENFAKFAYLHEKQTVRLLAYNECLQSENKFAQR